jgi:hypothetical protein
MMKKLFTLAFLLNNFFCNGQNYQCLQSGVKHYFTNSNGYLRGIRIDSVQTSGSDVIYYPFHTPRGNYYTSGPTVMLDSNGGSWLGKKVVRHADGTFLFDNLWHDTIIIKTQANVGDSWIFYGDTTPLYYQANVTETDTMTISGSIDSIKRILITAHNSMGIVSTDPANNFEIILSKNNGFAKIFDLFTFPYHNTDTVYTHFIDFFLDYIIPNTGPLIPTEANSIFTLTQLINPTFEQLYQWNVGDIYEYATCDDYFEHYGTSCMPVEHYVMDSIAVVTTTTSNVNYNFNGWISNYISPWPVSTMYPSYGPFIYSNLHKSGVLSYDSTLLIDTNLMPEEFHQSTIYYYFPNDTSYCTISPLYELQSNHELSGAQYIPPFESYNAPSIYKSPLGLLSSLSAYQDGGGIVYAQKLIYYNRSGSECGSILIPPTSVKDINTDAHKIALFPSPAANDLTIRTTNTLPYTITIQNMIGQTVTTKHTTKEQETINVSNLPAGVYNVSITDESGNRYNDKVVIVH